MVFDIMLSFDKLLFEFINKGFVNPYLDIFFLLVTYLGSIVIWGIAGMVLLVKNKELGIKVLVGTLINGIIIFFLKGFFLRGRPADNARVLINEDSLSFPSGHSSQSFTMAKILSKYFPKWKLIFYLFAILIMISRIYIGVHYPIDTIAGAMVGIIVGWAICKLNWMKVLFSR